MTYDKRIMRPSHVKERIYKRMRLVRNPNSRSAYTAQELSLCAGMAKTTLSVMQYYSLSDSEINKIAKLLYVSKEWLLTGKGEVYDAPIPMKPTEKFNQNLEWCFANFFKDLEAEHRHHSDI